MTAGQVQKAVQAIAVRADASPHSVMRLFCAPPTATGARGRLQAEFSSSTARVVFGLGREGGGAMLALGCDGSRSATSTQHKHRCPRGPTGCPAAPPPGDTHKAGGALQQSAICWCGTGGFPGADQAISITWDTRPRRHTHDASRALAGVGAAMQDPTGRLRRVEFGPAAALTPGSAHRLQAEVPARHHAYGRGAGRYGHGGHIAPSPASAGWDLSKATRLGKSRAGWVQGTRPCKCAHNGMMPSLRQRHPPGRHRRR